MVHTPGTPLVVEQIIRPTGLLDPKITLKPLKNQIDDTIELWPGSGSKPRSAFLLPR
jgi:excinuclease UvrABC helicase subunit UvrB